MTEKHTKAMPNPIRIAVTGPAGQIGYAALFRIAAGAMLGRDQPVILSLLERDHPTYQSVLKGVMYELEDCAFPLLADMQAHTDPKKAFEDADIALLFGARPRGPGMERSELLESNAPIFIEQGRALDEAAKRSVKVLVVGSPCNTNAWLAMQSAPSLSRSCFASMLRLDQNRAMGMLAKEVGAPVSHVHQVAVWGNHSPTMFADLSFATVDGEKALSLVKRDWYENTFIPAAARRGNQILATRGMGSAASAANAVIDTMREWCLGSMGEWRAMGVPSDGSYGIPEGLVCGMPLVFRNGGYDVVQGLGFDDFARSRIERTVHELEAERDVVAPLLGKR